MTTLTFDGVDIRRTTDNTIVLDLVGGFDDEAEVRGEDTVIPGKAGRAVRDRVKDRRSIELRGYVQGIGSSLTARRTSYRGLIDELHGIFDPTASPAALVVTAPYMGLTSGTKTINARFLNAIWDDDVLGFFRRVSVELECVDSPPEWT
jgi:hypothetical protein